MGFKSAAKRIATLAFATTDVGSIIAEIDHADVVSFDIFDTLIKRNAWDPEDVFEMVALAAREGIIPKGVNWRMERVAAERRAREASSREEVTLSEIYARISFLDQEGSTELMALEERVELEVCQPNRAMLPVWDYTLAVGKHIVITSDMYLGRTVVERILRNAGFTGYERLYLSSEMMCTKAKGGAFQLLKRDYPGARILHIGDNPRGDYASALSHGANAVLIPRRQWHLCWWPRPSRRDGVDGRTVSAFLNNVSAERMGLPQAIGTEVLGPMLLGYCMWLHRRVRSCGAEKLFFLSREGKLYQEAYRILYPDDPIPSSYLMVSRRALVIPSLSATCCWQDFLERIRLFLHEDEVEVVGNVCGIPQDDFAHIVKDCGIPAGSSIFGLDTERLDSLYAGIMGARGKYFLEQDELVSAYIKQEGLSGNAALSDIGYSGTMQRLLAARLGERCSLSGFYFGVQNMGGEFAYDGLHREGWLFEVGRNADINRLVRFTSSVFEFLMLNPEGSVSGYRQEGPVVIPVLGESEYGEASATLSREIQDAALGFIRMARSDDILSHLDKVEPEMAAHAYYRCFGRPSSMILEMLEPVRFSDGSVQAIIPSGFRHYLRNPSNLRHDFETSRAKVLFLAAALGTKFPWFELLSLAESLGARSAYRKKYYAAEGRRKAGTE